MGGESKRGPLGTFRGASDKGRSVNHSSLSGLSARSAPQGEEAEPWLVALRHTSLLGWVIRRRCLTGCAVYGVDDAIMVAIILSNSQKARSETSFPCSLTL